MRIRTLLLLALGVLLAAPAAARAEQLRLRNGEYLQGEILGDRTDEQKLTIRLYRTGGVFELSWGRLIPEDEDRIREDLGLKSVSDEIPLVPGHEVLLRSGQPVYGVVLNPDEAGAPLRLKTATGELQYQRSMVAKVTPTKVEALEVYTAEELAERREKELNPQTPSAWVELGDFCMQVGAYEAAKRAYDSALADADFAASERANTVKNRMKRLEILLRAKDATDRVKEIKLLLFRDRFDEALAAVDQLSADYAGSPDILEILDLDKLKRQITDQRRGHYLTEVRRRFYRTMNTLISKKVREKDATITQVLQWAQNQRGLARDVFAAIAEDTGLPVEEVQQLWDERTSRQVHRYNYGSGTFMNREVRERVQKALALSRAGQARQNQNRNNRNNRPPAAQQKPETPTTPEEWWKQSSPRDKEDFVRAWFAEYAGVLEVLRFENRLCPACAGKGVTISRDPMSDEEVRHICDACNLAGHERIVIVR